MDNKSTFRQSFCDLFFYPGKVFLGGYDAAVRKRFCKSLMNHILIFRYICEHEYDRISGGIVCLLPVSNFRSAVFLFRSNF